MRLFLVIVALLMPIGAVADTRNTVERSVTEHILPGFEQLSSQASSLAEAAKTECSPESEQLRSAFHNAFDAWIAVGHLRFGPTEAENRAFALAFWPDPRSKTPKALTQLIRVEDPVVDDPEGFQTVSVAARGFYALERLLYDPAFADGNTDYVCRLVKAMAADISATSEDIHADWVRRYAPLMISAEGDGPYTNPNEALRELFKALSTGLQFSSEVRLGRPLGTFERPRPRRAEARLSERSLRHVALSLQGMDALAIVLATGHPEVGKLLALAFAAALETAADLNDPVFASVVKPPERLKVEILQQRIERIRETVRDELGPALGVGAGFNALDGD